VKRNLPWTGLVAALATAPACVTDHDALAKRPPGGSAGAAGAGGMSGASGGAGGGSGSGGSGGQLDAAIDAPTEPTGADRITLLHGVADAETIAFCFARPGAAEPGGDPIPRAGLTYGARLAIQSIAGFDLARDDVEPIVIAAGKEELATLSCAELVERARTPIEPDASASEDAAAELDAGDLDAGDLDAGEPDAGEPDAGDGAAGEPPIRARELAMLPAGTLSGGYSTLLVAAGCLGGPGHVDSISHLICGNGYAPDRPTLAPVVVRLSRLTDPTHVGLQVVHASVPTDAVSLRSIAPPESSTPTITVASGVVYGAIAPRPPQLAYTALQIGASGEAKLEARSTNDGSTLSVPWREVLQSGGISGLKDGKNYAVVLVGPRLSITGTSWWDLPKLTIVPSDP
jgi:hypothetical protein